MEAVFYAMPFLWTGLLVTVQISLLVVVISLVIGLLTGVGITYGPWFVRWPIRLYVDVIRGIPVLIIVFFVFYALPGFGINIGPFTSGVVALSAFKVGHVTETIRGAIQSIHPGQMEAGKAIGLKFWQRVAYVVAPQALRRFLPPWINQVTEVVKGSALVSLVGVVDLMLSLQQVIGRTYLTLPMYLLGCFIYFFINYSLSYTSRTLEARYAYIRD